MTCVSRYAGAVIATIAFVGSPAAEACGYHNPKNASRGVLNWTYPNSLYVRTAVWMAQREGIIPHADQSQAAQALLSYQRAVTLLGAFRKRLVAARDGNAAPAFSLVFIGSMLWSRYEATGTVVNMTAHLDNPAIGDVVIVSDEPVIAGIIDGRLTPAVARDLGLMRYYGAPERVHELVSWLNRLPVQSMTDAAKIGQ